jgi:autotransporter-associated beta strand protein
MSQLTASAFQAYDPNNASSIVAGPTALYTVSVDNIMPTQLNEGLTEVGKKSDGFNEITSAAALQSNLLTDIEPVVIGPDGKLYLTDGHHTFTALEDSAWGTSNPTVYVNVIANYSNLTEAQFFATMQAKNLLLPLNDGVPETVNDSTGAPIPTSLTALTSNVYRGLEYSILKNKSSKLYPSSGSTTPGLDKMTGFYSDFLEAAAYQNANGGLGLSYLSPYDVSLSTTWNLTGSNLTTLPNVSSPVHVYQLPGYILGSSLTQSGQNGFAPGGISNSTLANGALDGNGTFTGITQINAGNAASGPILIGTPNTGFIMQLGVDKGGTVTLSGGGINTYTGGTSILAGTLIITDDTSLGAAATGGSIDPANVKTSVQNTNGIVFNSLTEGNATLTIGTTAGNGTTAFSTSRNIAVGGEAANLNLNGYIVTLNGQIASLGTNGVGIGNATGFSDLTVEDNSSSANGVLKLSQTANNSGFYGNWIVTSGTLQVSSDSSLGNTTGPSYTIGQIVLNGGTLQAGASFSSVRSLSVLSNSTFDTAGFTTSFTGALSDVQRNLTITNTASGTAGKVTFGSFQIGSALELTVSKGSGTSTAVTFTNGIQQTAASDQVLLAGLSSTATITSGTAPALTNGIVAPWIIIDSGAGTNPYDFATYGANGFTAFTGYATIIKTATSSSVVKQSANATLNSGNTQAYALNLQSGVAVTIGSGNTLTLGDGTYAGLILNGSSSGLTGGTLAFGAAEADVTMTGSNAITSAISGSGGLNIDGTGTLTLSTASTETGLVTVNSGTLALSGQNIFSGDTQGILLQNTSKLAKANLNVSANNQLAVLSSAGTNSTVTISNSAVLTIGDSTNQSSTLNSAIKETGTGVAGALTKAGTGLLDISAGGGVTLTAGGTVVVQAGALRIANGIFGATATNGITVNAGAELQYAGNGGSQFKDPISGAGVFHLLAGTVQLTGTNSYTGGTVIESGATLDVMTTNLPAGGNIINAGGTLDFDQTVAGTFTGVMSDGHEAGGPDDPNAMASSADGPLLSGNLIIDDSTGADTGNVTIDAVQTYTGATYIEAGTLTLGVANAIADSSGVTLGRVGTSTTATLALGANNTLASLSSDPGSASVIENTSVVLNGHVLTLDPASGVSSSFGGVISDTGTGSVVIAGTGTVAFTGANTFTGGVTIDSGTFELGNAQAAGAGAITFANAPQVGPTLQIDGTVMPANNIDGFTSSDVIDLAGIANQSSSSADFNYTTNILSVTEGTSIYQLHFDPTQSFAGEYFHLTPDMGGAGTDIAESTVACYCRGTSILTDQGEVAVEMLAIGDRVVTASGQTRPIKWIGKRSYGGRFLMGRKDILPIRIEAGAIEDNVPKRDLLISPHHAMLIDGVLIEGKDLVNGVTIAQVEQADKVEYFHIELESHDVLLAEGAASESFIDDDSRGMFHNAHEFAKLYPDAGQKLAVYCAPRVEEGPALDQVQRRLRQRAGIQVTPQHPIGDMRGNLDVIDGTMIYGWAQNIEHPSMPVCLDVVIDGIVVAQTLANIYREDLAIAGIGMGAHAFKVAMPYALASDVEHIVEIKRSADGETLHQLSRIIERDRSAA